MKKVLSILLIASAVMLFASCLIVTEVPKYSITFRNELSPSPSNNVFDWYVKNSSGTNFTVTSYATSVTAGGGRSTKYGLDRDHYRVIFTFNDTTDSYEPDTYYQSSLIYLDHDKEYTIVNSSSYIMVTLPSVNRSAIGEENNTENLITEFQIVDSDGNAYPIYRCEKE